MGEMADILYDDAPDGHEEWLDTLQAHIDDNAERGYWETSDGLQMPFNEISDKHCFNIVKWCEESGVKAPKELTEQRRNSLL